MKINKISQVFHLIFKQKKTLFLLFLLLVWYSLFLIQPIDLTTADLGRHLENGKLILQGNFGHLFTNYYSSTYPDFPFVNHHFGAAVIFYLILKIGGFSGLHLFFISLSFITLILIFLLTKKEAGTGLALLLSFLAIPLIAQRNEVRPEVFTYLFAVIFFWILWHYQKLNLHELTPITSFHIMKFRGAKPRTRKNTTIQPRVYRKPDEISHCGTRGFLVRGDKISSRILYLLPILEILWVNCHIYFFLGPVLIGVFFLEQCITHFFKTSGRDARFWQQSASALLPGASSRRSQKKNKIKNLGLILILTILATLLNPFLIRGAIYPLRIFQNYGYMIVENKSVIFLEKYGLANPNLLLFEIIFSLLVLSFILVLWWRRQSFSITLLLLGAFCSLMGWWALRNFTLFGLFAIPILAINFKNALSAKIKLNVWPVKIGITALILFVILFIASDPNRHLTSQLRLGLLPGNNAAAEFFQKEKITGPIFNNYDIGSYLIFHLCPQEKVFVDNRPEAYPASFFQDTYIPMQENNEVWQEQDKVYNFNAIFFAYHDLTPWAQKFLNERLLNDPAWAPVFADQYALIFLKKDARNEVLIQKYEIPVERFNTQ